MKKDLFFAVSCIFICLFAGIASAKSYTYYSPSDFKSIKYWTFGDPNLETPEVSKEPSELDKNIEEFMELARQNMSVGFPDSGVPPLDPLNIPDVVIDINKAIFSGKATVSDILVKGIKDFKVNSIRFVMRSMSAVFDISVPIIKAGETYGVHGRALSFMPIEVNGQSMVTLNSIRVTGVIKLDVSLFGASLNSYKIHFSLGDYNIHLENTTGFRTVDKVIDWVVKLVSTGFINHHQDALTKILDEQITAIVKHAFDHISIADLIT